MLVKAKTECLEHPWGYYPGLKICAECGERKATTREDTMTPVNENATTAVATVDAAKIKGQIVEMFSTARPGFEEGAEKGDLTIPRARLLQSTSDEVKKDPRKFFAGSLINSVTKEVLPATFVPIKRLPNNWIRFNARKNDDPNYVPGIEPGGVVWRSEDPKDPRVKEETKFGAKGEPPAAITFMNFLCYFEGFTLPVVLSFSKTSYKAGQDFLTMCYAAPGAMYAHRYRVTSVMKTAKGNSFFVLTVEKAGESSQDELSIGETFHRHFANVAVKVHEDETVADEEAAGTSFPHGANA